MDEKQAKQTIDRLTELVLYHSRCYYEQDAPEILCAIPSEECRAQQEQEYAVFRRFLAQNKAADIPEEQAMNALRSLILTVPMRKKLGEDYPQILLWMAQGICAQIFG